MSNEFNKDMRKARRLSHVPRWVVAPTLNKQSVAEHSFQVASLSVWLLGHLGQQGFYVSSKMENDILRLALSHDNEEAVTGDHPSTSKGVKNYDEWEWAELFVKVCDLLEATVFIYEECLMGNRRVGEIQIDLINRMGEVWPHFVKKEIRGADGLLTCVDHHYSGSHYTLINKCVEESFCAHPALEK